MPATIFALLLFQVLHTEINGIVDPALQDSILSVRRRDGQQENEWHAKPNGSVGTSHGTVFPGEICKSVEYARNGFFASVFGDRQVTSSEKKRLLGVDFGKVRVGLAASDPDRILASPLTTYQRGDKDQDARFFRQLVDEESIGAIVVGLPVHLSGHEGESAVAARRFGQWLAELTGLPVSFFDERFTSVEAESALLSAGLTNKRRKARRDRVAAQILLQSYLEAGCPTDEGTGPLDA